VTLKSKFVEPLMVETAKFRSETAERSDERELRGVEVTNQTKPLPLRDLKATLGLTFRVQERIAGREKVCGYAIAAKYDKGEWAHLRCGVECAMQQIPARPKRFRPWHDAIA
jgi:hypothetical protein